jgi:hypothetical protein
MDSYQKRVPAAVNPPRGPVGNFPPRGTRETDQREVAPDHEQLRDRWVTNSADRPDDVLIEPAGPVSTELVAGTKVYNLIMFWLAMIWIMLAVIAGVEIMLLIKFSAFLTAVQG